MTFILFIFFLSALGNIMWKGMGSILDSLESEEILFAIRLSLLTSATSTLICLFFALPVAYCLERYKFLGRKLIKVVLNIPISLPPLVSGVALLLFFANTSFGAKLSEIGLNFIFSVN